MEYTIFTEPQQGFSYDDQLAFAQTAERLGFDAFFRSDHYMRMGPGDPLPARPTRGRPSPGSPGRPPASGSALSSRRRHRHPAVLAIQVAQVDAMSNGRVEFGLGTGWFEAEHRALGIPFPAKRFGPFEEQLEIVTGLWATPAGETFSFAGDHYVLEDAPALPKPVQSRMPVIIGGGGARRTPELAARFATEFNIGFRPEHEIGPVFDRVRAACERIGRDPSTLKLSVALTTYAGAGDAELERRAANGGRTLSDVRDGTNIVGGAEEIAEKVERLRALGADRIHFQLMDLRDVEHVEFLGSALPLLPR